MDSTIDNDNARYLLTVSIGSNTSNTRVIAIDLSTQWTDEDGAHMPISLWRFSAQSFNSEINATTNAQRIVFGAAGGYKYYMSNALYSDNGSAITTEIVTPLMPFDGALGIENCLRRMYGTYKTTGGTLTISSCISDSEE